MVRLDILAEAATATLRPKRDGDKFYENETAKAEALKKILAIIKRARSAINRRHEVIHEAWGVEPSTGEVIGSRLPWQNPGMSRSLTMLNNLIRDMRKVIGDAYLLGRNMRQKHPTMIDLRIEPDGKIPR